MLDADARIKASGIEPNADSLPKTAAGENERNLVACERQLVEAGYDAEAVDAKMRHIVLVAEAEAIRRRDRLYFKPAVIWKPANAARAADTSLAEAATDRVTKHPRAGPQSAPPRDARTGRIEPKAATDYPDGDVKL